MKTRDQKLGNSLAGRIPKSVAAEAGFRVNAAVELSVVDGALVVQPVLPQPLSLDHLLRGINKNNLQGEWSMGRLLAGRSGR